MGEYVSKIKVLVKSSKEEESRCETVQYQKTENAERGDRVALYNNEVKRYLGFPITVAIDLGTAFSGYAIQFTDDNTDRGKENEPTVVLLDKNERFLAYGETAYKLFLEKTEEERKKLHLFRNFKMCLYDKTYKLSRETRIPDDNGKHVDALKVFSSVIRHLKSQILNAIRTKTVIDNRDSSINDKDIGWVITIPAIWDDSSRQFMREAAEKAGIPEEQMRLVLEPEAASRYCRSEKLVHTGCGDIKSMGIGHKYIIANLGGGTVDICAHEILEGHRLRELHRATGNDAGGTTVNQRIYEFIRELFGQDVVKEHKQLYPDSHADIMDTFETAKKYATDERDVIVVLETNAVDELEQISGKTLTEVIKASPVQYRGLIKDQRCKLLINSELMKRFFDPSIDAIICLLEEILKACSSDEIKTLLLVGGYSESKYVQSRIRDKFHQLHTVTPPDARLAVLRGAMLMGQESQNIIERRSKFTFGFAVGRPFVEGEHPENLKSFRDGIPFCRHIFRKLIEKNQIVRFNDRYEIYIGGSFHKDKSSKHTQLQVGIWKSSNKNPKYCTSDEQCEEIGKIIMCPPSCGWPDQVVRKHVLVVGETEFKVQVINENTGDKYEAALDFLLKP